MRGRLTIPFLAAALAGCAEEPITDVEEPGRVEQAICGPSCGTETAFDAGKTPTTRKWVSTSGNDTWAGTETAPYRTIDRALQAASAGTEIRVAYGIYNESIYEDVASRIQGTSTNPIWITGYGAQKPVIQGSLQLSGAQYFVIQNIEVVNGSGDGINLDDNWNTSTLTANRPSHHIIIRNVYVHDTGGTGSGVNQDCLKISGVDDVLIVNSRFRHCAASGPTPNSGVLGSAIDMVGCQSTRIIGNTFEENGANSVQVKGGADDVDIRGNVFTDGGLRAVNMGGRTDDVYFRPPLAVSNNYEARSVRLHSNLIIRGAAPFAFVNCYNCSVKNNTIVNPTTYFLRLLNEHYGESDFMNTKNGTLDNNIWYYTSSGMNGTPFNVGNGVDTNTFWFNNNIWRNTANPGVLPTGRPGTESGALASDPGFVSPSTGNYHITTSSAAYTNTGVTGGPTGDIDFECFRSPPSRGADEPVSCSSTWCGDATCNGTETCSTCATDCGACAPACGDSVCNGSETCATCATDCGSCCGNGVCAGSETCSSCPSDCGSCSGGQWCWNGFCDGSETTSNCPQDCGSGGTCGNSVCDLNEDPTTCSQDCSGWCNDGTCQHWEGIDCPHDCGCVDSNLCNSGPAEAGCWCDEACVQFNDCCGQLCAACGIDC